MPYWIQCSLPLLLNLMFFIRIHAKKFTWISLKSFLLILFLFYWKMSFHFGNNLLLLNSFRKICGDIDLFIIRIRITHCIVSLLRIFVVCVILEIIRDIRSGYLTRCCLLHFWEFMNHHGEFFKVISFVFTITIFI